MLFVQHLSLSIAGSILLNDISFELAKGQTLCIAGESGSGKSSLLRALNGLMPSRFERIEYRPSRRSAIVQERKWLGVPGLPGSRWVMQDPIAALNPKLALGSSIKESLFSSNMSPAELEKAVSIALSDVELSHSLAKRRPSEVSIGQAQRACLARALIARPDLVFFDEPLSALDAVVQKQVAATMKQIQQRYGISFVIVTHDLGFAAAFADQILVLRRGEVEAYQSARAFFLEPASSYCRELIEAAQTLGSLQTPVSKDTAGREGGVQ